MTNPKSIQQCKAEHIIRIDWTECSNCPASGLCDPVNYSDRNRYVQFAKEHGTLEDILAGKEVNEYDPVTGRLMRKVQ